jgi:hypothetical protein
MSRIVCLGFASIFVISGCRTLEREGAVPLPEDAPPLSYIDMVNRARGQAASALDAYYIDAWLELEQAAQRLEQTARLLPKSTHVPERFKSTLAPEADQLRKDAAELLEAARGRNAKQVNDTMQRINLRIRQLRPPEKKLESDSK